MKHSLQAITSDNRPSFIWLVGLLVIFTQLVAAAHASQHAFHEADEICILYSVSEQSPAAETGLSRIHHEHRTEVLHVNRSVKVSRETLLTSNRSRAPPEFL